MDFSFTDEQRELQSSIAKVCSKFGDSYWLARDNDGKFPFEFTAAVAEAGYFGATIPEEYGGAGLGLTEAAIIMREVGRLGGAAMTSVQLNIFGPHPMVKFGTHEQKLRLLPRLVNNQDRACFSVTEPDAGLNTTQIKTFAVKKGNKYVVNGRKIWTSSAQNANKIVLLTRTTRFEDCKKSTDGMTLFYTDLDRSKIEIREIAKMGRKAVDSNELFIDNFEIPEADRIGEEGKGFHYLLHSINPERICVAAGFIGGTLNVLEKAARYARERVVFGRPIGQNQAIQHPLAQIWVETQAAELLLFRAAGLYDADQPCGLEVNALKYFVGEMYLKAATQAVRTHGGMGFAKEFHIERNFRECMLAILGPASQELVLCFIAERALGMPKSY